MDISPDVLVTVHLIVQGGFVGITFLFAMVSFVNRLRVRNALLSWRTGGIKGIPVGPVGFLVLAALFTVYVLGTEQGVSPMLYAGYLVGGVFWCAAALLSPSVVLTEQGVVQQEEGGIDQAVAWVQIVDYFVASEGQHVRVAFFYTDDAGMRRRIDLTVPHRCRTAFRQIVANKLDARFERAARHVYGREELEG